MPDAGTLTIAGMTALSIQIVVMSQLRRLILAGRRADRLFDLCNYPVAFAIVTLANPPWPVWEWREWQVWAMLSIALATLASVTAKKAGDAKPRATEHLDS